MATTCSTPSSHSPATVSTPFQFASAGEANSYRLKAIVERLNFIMSTSKGGIRFDSSEFFGLCFALARGVDYALTVNDVPAVSYRLPSLIKEVYTRRKEISLQPAIMVLMISVKNACKSGWFSPSDADDLLSMTNELFSSFCMKLNVAPGVINALDIIPKVVSRFYPQLKFCSLIVSFEVKPGYEVLMSDFQIPRNVSPEEKIKLLVVQADNLETSSCLISPAQVSFMVNGKGVDRRTNVSMDTGPQFPTDITKMLKYGTNILQAIGYFSGTYLIALAFMSIMVPFHAPALKDYVQPVISTASADPEIIEGASRITLNCPISFRRIKTPVKGHLCKHHQCFDYDNFIEMNTRKPSWRCPFCNQPVSFIDLRIDQHMVKVLKEVGEDVTDIVISADGSWKAVAGQNRSKDQLAGENQGPQGCSSGGNTISRSASTLADAVDLTMGEDDAAKSPSSMEHLNGYISQNQNHACETEDIKPFRETNSIRKFSSEPLLTIYPSMNAQPSSSPGNDFWPRTLPSSSASNLSLANTSADARVGGTSATVLPSFLVIPVTTNAVSPALNQEPLLSLEASQLNCSYQQLSGERSLAENMQLQARFGNLMVSQEADRLLIPRHVNRNPIAVQALPVPAAQPPSTFKRMRITGPNLDGQNAATGDTEVQELMTSGLSMPQNSSDQNHQDINRSAMQYLSGLTSSIPVNTRLSSSLQRGAGAYRVNPQSSSDTRMSTDSHNNLSNLRTPQASLILPSTFRSTATLPPAATRELARQVTQQKVTPHIGAILNYPPSRTAAAASATGGEPSRNVAELPPENWRPTGRMRGSLTGSAYSAALSHYLAPGQPVPSRPVAQPVQLINSAATVGARGAAVHQAAPGQNDGRSQPGGSSN